MPDIGELAKFGIGLQQVQEALRRLDFGIEGRWQVAEQLREPYAAGAHQQLGGQGSGAVLGELT